MENIKVVQSSSSTLALCLLWIKLCLAFSNTILLNSSLEFKPNEVFAEF